VGLTRLRRPKLLSLERIPHLRSRGLQNSIWEDPIRAGLSRTSELIAWSSAFLAMELDFPATRARNLLPERSPGSENAAKANSKTSSPSKDSVASLRRHRRQFRPSRYPRPPRRRATFQTPRVVPLSSQQETRLYLQMSRELPSSRALL
jgi:hypothetical protein